MNPRLLPSWSGLYANAILVPRDVLQEAPLDSLHQEHPASEATSKIGSVVMTASDSHSEADEEDAEPQYRRPAFEHSTSTLLGRVAS